MNFLKNIQNSPDVFQKICLTRLKVEDGKVTDDFERIVYEQVQEDFVFLSLVSTLKLDTVDPSGLLSPSEVLTTRLESFPNSIVDKVLERVIFSDKITKALKQLFTKQWFEFVPELVEESLKLAVQNITLSFWIVTDTKNYLHLIVFGSEQIFSTNSKQFIFEERLL